MMTVSLYDSSDYDNFLDIFPEPKSKVTSENIQQKLAVGDLRAGSETGSVDSEIGSAETANISDLKIITSTKTYTRKKESIMLSKLKNVTSDQQLSSQKYIEQNNTIQENKLLFQNVPNSDIPNTSSYLSKANKSALINSVNTNVKKRNHTCESVEDNSTGCNEFQESDISPITPQKKLKGAYARTRKNLVQKIESNNDSNLSKSTRHTNVKSSAKIKNPIKVLPISSTDSTSYSNDDSKTFSLDSLINSPIKPSNLHTNASNSQTYVHEKKTFNNGMSLMDMLKKYSLKTNDNLFNDVPVSKSLDKKCNSEKSQPKKISEEKAVISNQSPVNSFLETETKNKKESTKIIKSAEKKGNNLAIKSKKQLKSKICSIVPYNKNVTTPRNEPTHTFQMKTSSSLDGNLTNISELNSSQKDKFVAASVENHNNFVSLNSNPGFKSISSSNGYIPVENHMTEFLTPITLNSGTVYNTIPQINPVSYQPNTLIPSTTPSNISSICVFPFRCMNCLVTPSPSQIAHALNKSAEQPTTATIFTIVNNNLTSLDSIRREVDSLLHQSAQQNNLINLGNDRNMDPVRSCYIDSIFDLPNSVNLTNASNNFSPQCTVINKQQTNINNIKSSSLGVENSSITNQESRHDSAILDSDSDVSEEDTVCSNNSDKMAAFISYNESLMKAVHNTSFEELRNNVTKQNNTYMKFKTVRSFYSHLQVQEVLQSFCSPYVHNFPIKYKLPSDFKDMDFSSLLKDYVKFHVQHIVEAHPQIPFNESRFSVLEKGKSQLNFFEKDLFKIMCTKRQKLDLKYLIEILSFVGTIILYTEYVKVKNNGS